MMHDMGKVQCDMHLQLRYTICLWNYSFFVAVHLLAIWYWYWLNSFMCRMEYVMVKYGLEYS